MPVTTQANAGEAGADGKDSGLFEDAGHLEDGLMFQSPAPPLFGDRGFITRERGTEQGDQGRGLKSSLHAEEHSPFLYDK